MGKCHKNRKIEESLLAIDYAISEYKRERTVQDLLEGLPLKEVFSDKYYDEIIIIIAKRKGYGLTTSS